jgi:preprotein translocase subunit YajC
MNTALLTFAQAQPPAGGGLNMIIFLGLMFAGMWFLMIAPQRKKQKQHEKMLKELTAGDNVITTGGIYGTITSVKEDRFVVKVADNSRIEFAKSAVANRVEKSNS